MFMSYGDDIKWVSKNQMKYEMKFIALKEMATKWNIIENFSETFISSNVLQLQFTRHQNDKFYCS